MGTTKKQLTTWEAARIEKILQKNFSASVNEARKLSGTK